MREVRDIESRPFLRSRLGLLLGLVAVVAVAAGWSIWPSPPSDKEPSKDSPQTKPFAPTPGLPWFVDVTAASGIDFRHYDSATPIHYIQETMGSGLAWIDYNNDGWLDLFCVQDGPVRPEPGSGPWPTSKLYRNNGDGTFTDVTREVGLDRAGFGMGCAVGDFDNDGFDDLVVTYLGGIVLYHNEPDGKGGRCFVDITAKAGLHDTHWASSCAFGDLHGHGFLDLYVCNYVEVDLDNYPNCGNSKTNVRGSCAPEKFQHVVHQLYRNNGNGTFTDISVSSGIASAPPAPGLGVVMVDLDGDGRLDIYVANDMKPAYLFHNQGGGRFIEKALVSGCGMGPLAIPVAGMGVEAGDVDGSGRPSLFVTNFQGKPNVLYRNQGNLFFLESSNPSGLGSPSIDRLKFGTVLFDPDLGGVLDIAVANGHIHRTAKELTGDSFAQEAQLFMGDGKGHFRDVSGQVGEYFRQRHVGRGLAWADYDNDGLPDLAFSNNAGPIALLRNRTETSNRWLRLELIGDGKKTNRNAIGARVEIEAGGKKQVRWILGGGSYLSASERRLLVGLGQADHADKVTVFWPGERKQEFGRLEGRRWWRLHENQDRPVLVDPKALLPKR